MPTMPCGHTAKLLGSCVLVCAIGCDDTRPRCMKCNSPELGKHDFGSAPHERWHGERWPDAVHCNVCGEVMHYGGRKP
jgi:hypothetical protein